MTKENKILNLECRKARLLSRVKENTRIIEKIDRKIALLK